MLRNANSLLFFRLNDIIYKIVLGDYKIEKLKELPTRNSEKNERKKYED